MSIPRTCHDCGKPMRACRRTEDEFPGTVLHYGRGACKNCYYRRQQNGTLDALPTLRRTQPEVQDASDDPRRHARNIEGLAAFIRRRHASGLPDEGTLRQIEGMQ